MDESFVIPGGDAMAKVTVRRARPEDLDALLDLWQEMMDYHARLDRRFVPAAEGKRVFRPTIEAWMADELWRVLVAVADGQVVGYTIGRIADNAPVFEMQQYGYVTDICVAADWRRAGVGRRLFTALRTWFRRHGLTVVQLNVAAVNPVSQAFWRAMGFGDYLDRMWLDL
jgi:ribosomal protein S18 acetylase RimI-like enzyme